MCEDMDRVRINLKVKGRVRFSVRNSFTKFPFLCYMASITIFAQSNRDEKRFPGNPHWT